VYFDNTNSQWTTDYICILIGNSSYSKGYAMTAIPNTNLYYRNDFSYNVFGGLAFIGSGSEWSGKDENYNTRRTYATKYTNNYSGSLDKCCLFIPEGSSNGTSIDYRHVSSKDDYKDLLHKGQTVVVYVSDDGGVTYTAADTWYGTFTADYYQLSDYNATESKHKTLANTSEANAKATCVRSSTVTFTESATAAGYVFNGWGTTAAGPTVSGATYSYTVDGTKTIYAFFMDNRKNLVVTTESDAKGSVTGDTRHITSFDNPYTITATPASGYVFDRWVVTNGEVEYTNGTSETDATAQINISDNVAMHATFKAPMTIYYVPLASEAARADAGEHVFKLNVQYTPTGESATYIYHTMVKIPDTYYHCRPVYKYEAYVPDLTYPIGFVQFQVRNSNNDWVSQIEKTSVTTVSGWNGQMVVATGSSAGDRIAYTTEGCYDIAVASENESYGTVSVSEISAYNGSAVSISATPEYGYVFAGWEVSDPGIVLADATSASTTVSATAAGTITATFAEELEVRVSVVGTFNSWGSDETPRHFIRRVCTDHVAYFTKHLTANTYEFKLINNFSNTNEWLGNTGTINKYTSFATWWQFNHENEPDNNCRLEIPFEADYTFAINLDNMRLMVQYPVQLTISAAKYASYYGNKNLIIPEGITAQYVTDWNNTILAWKTLNDYIPAETGVILSGAPGTYIAYVTEETEDATGNMLKGSLSDEVIDNACVHYILSAESDGSRVGFYWPNEATVDDNTGVGQFTNKAKKAYLELPASGASLAPRRYVFGANHMPTGIENIQPSAICSQKFIMNGQLFIRQGEHTYNAQGKELR
jgi:inosine/xanthosine triphosphate pyrophosphatase family protein